MTAGDRIVSELLRGSLKNDAPLQQQVGTVYDLESLTYVVISDQQGQSVFVAEL